MKAAKKRIKKKINKKTILKNIEKILKKVKDFLYKYKYVFLLILPFLLMDIITRLLGNNISFYKIYRIAPNLFTISWIILFVGLTLSFKDKIGKIIYLFFNIIFLVLFLTNNIYYSMTKTFFDFNLLESASEGAPYIVDTIKNCNPIVYITFIIIVITIIIAYKKIPSNTSYNNKLLIKTILLFLSILYAIMPHS